VGIKEAKASLRAPPRSSWWLLAKARVEDAKKQLEVNDVGDLASSIWSAGMVNYIQSMLLGSAVNGLTRFSSFWILKN
jgi:hypothetical protein